jgi:hypothetical protein
MLQRRTNTASRRAWPVYVIGSMRSGTTLLRYILDAHERLACPPETKFVAGLEAFLDYPQVLRALSTLGLGEEAIYTRLGEFVDSILSEYAVRRGKKRWVDKTPNYYRLTPLIDRMFRGSVLYVVMVRNPLDCIASLETFLSLVPYHEDPDIARLAHEHGKGRYAWARYWCHVYDRIRFAIQQSPERFMLIKYEDLVSETEQVVRRLLDFLGERYSDGLIKRAFSESHDHGYQDMKITMTKRVHAKSVGRSVVWPKTEMSAVWTVVRETAEYYGYRRPTP